MNKLTTTELVEFWVLFDCLKANLQMQYYIQAEENDYIDSFLKIQTQTSPNSFQILEYMK